MSISAAGLPQGTFAVDANGQATYRLPIEVPPGIAGFQPHLELVYAHHVPNGVLGVGWTLAGLSAITRVKATYAVDGFMGAVRYDAQDRLALDGRRLIAVDGEYLAGGTLYRTELESWQHVRALPGVEQGFRVVARNGELREYGTTEDSRVRVHGGDDVRVFALAAATDRNGNRIEFHYTPSPAGAGPGGTGAYYLDEIRYTTRTDGTAAQRFVRFEYEQRPDPITSFAGGFATTLDCRLAGVAVLLGDAQVRRYELGYRTSAATGLSCLESITQRGAAPEVPALPATRLTWQDVAQPSFAVGPASSLDQHLGARDVRTLDVAGRGLTDLVQLWTDADGRLHATTYLASREGAAATYTRASDSVLGAYPDRHEVLLADVDGDGRTDLVVAHRSGPDGRLRLTPCLSNGSGFVAAPAFDTGDTWSAGHIAFLPMDANGDGRTDIVEAYADPDPERGARLAFRTYLSRLGGPPRAPFTTALVTRTEDPADGAATLALWPMDVDGNGMLDVVRVWRRGPDDEIVATAYVSVSRGLEDVHFSRRVESRLGMLNLANQIAFLPVDVDGDGTQDLLQVWHETGPRGTRLHLTTFLCDAAGAFVAGPDSVLDGETLEAADFFPMDVDGSGSPAIVKKWVSGDERLMFTAFRSSPSGRFHAAAPFDAGPAGEAVRAATFAPGDANGDGKADLLRFAIGLDGEIQVVPYVSTGPYPDLVTSILNPLGGRVDVTYAPLSDAGVYEPVAPAYPASTARRVPHALTPGAFPAQSVLGRAIYVVARHVQRNAPDANRFAYEWATSLRYAGGQIDLLGRGWQGFAQVRSDEQESSARTIASYNQTFPFTGTLASQQRLDGDALLQTVTTRYASFRRASGGGPLPADVVEVLPASTRTEAYDHGAARLDYALGRAWSYDDYGNAVREAQLGYVDAQDRPLEPGDVVYTHRRFQNQVAPDGWLLGLLLLEKRSARPDDADVGAFQPGDYQLARRTYTSPAANLASEARWDDVHTAWLTTAYEYDAFGNRVTETPPGLGSTRHEVDPDYHTFELRRTSPAGEGGQPLVTWYGYDPRFGGEAARRDANGAVWITARDAFGRVVLRQGPLPDRPGAFGDPNGVTPLVTGTPELRAAFLDAKVVTLESAVYDDDGQLGPRHETRALQSFPVDAGRELLWSRRYVDGNGRERERVRQSGQAAGNVVVLTDYDRQARVTRQSVPFFSQRDVVAATPPATATTYDALGRPLRREVPGGPDGREARRTTWAYGRGGEVTQTSAAGSDAPYVEVHEHHFYDGVDRVRRVTVDPAGEKRVSAFEYDALGRLVAAVDPPTPAAPQGVRNAVVYDALSRRRSFDNPDQNTTDDPSVRAMTYSYDSATGLVTRQADAAGRSTTFAHDPLGRLVRRGLPDGRQITYAYDDPAAHGAGRLTSASVATTSGDLESRHEFRYDPYGNPIVRRLTLDGEPSAYEIRSTFDPQRRLECHHYPDGTHLARRYAAGVLASQALDGVQVDYPLDHRDAARHAGQVVYGSGAAAGGALVLDYQFEPAGLLAAERLTRGRDVLLNLAYDHDGLGQLTAIADRGDGDAAASFERRNRRLVRAWIAGFDPTDYGYDAAGNLISKDGVSYRGRAHFASAGERDGAQVYAASADACGRTAARTADGTTLHFAYDGLGHVQEVSSGAQLLARMTSGYAGTLLRRVDGVSGDVTIYVDPGYVVTRDAAGRASVTKYLRDARGVAASVTTSADGASAARLYFRNDQKGSATHAFDAGGALVGRIAYDAWGLPRLLSGSDAFRRKYEQREWLAGLGLYDFGARYYDPHVGRFLTPDTQLGAGDLLHPGALNRYAFELGDPVDAIDPTGHFPWWTIGVAIGLAALTIGVGIALTPFGATFLGGLLAGAVIGGGLSGTIFSFSHMNVARPSAFFAGFAANVGVGAGLGLAVGGLSSGLSLGVDWATAGIQSTAWQFVARAAAYGVGGALLGSGDDVLGQLADNGIERDVLGEHVSLASGLGQAAIWGAVVGGFAGVTQAGIEAASQRSASARALSSDAVEPETPPAAPAAERVESEALLPPQHAPAAAVKTGGTWKTRAVLVAVGLGTEAAAVATTEALPEWGF